MRVWLKIEKLNGIGYFKNKSGEAYVGQFKNNNFDGLEIYFTKITGYMTVNLKMEKKRVMELCTLTKSF